jgi:uncharacterized protein YkwD
MALAARNHCKDMTENGAFNNIGSDLSSVNTRLEAYGTISRGSELE